MTIQGLPVNIDYRKVWETTPEDIRYELAMNLVRYLSFTEVCPIGTDSPCSYRNVQDEANVLCTDQEKCMACWFATASGNAIRRTKEA